MDFQIKKYSKILCFTFVKLSTVTVNFTVNINHSKFYKKSKQSGFAYVSFCCSSFFIPQWKDDKLVNEGLSAPFLETANYMQKKKICTHYNLVVIKEKIFYNKGMWLHDCNRI